MAKSMMNLNTLNALIREEDMSSREYLALARRTDTPEFMSEILVEISKDEAKHRDSLTKFKKIVLEMREAQKGLYK